MAELTIISVLDCVEPTVAGDGFVIVIRGLSRHPPAKDQRHNAGFFVQEYNISNLWLYASVSGSCGSAYTRLAGR